MNQELLRKYAKLAVVTGANVQKGQPVVLRTSTESKDLARLIVEEAYKVGARYVSVQWSDDYVSRLSMMHQSAEELENIRQWFIDQQKQFVEDGACFISITSPIPGLNKDVDPMKMQRVAIASQKALDFFQTHLMGNKVQWTIVGYPNQVWANMVFPNETEEIAYQKLMDSILYASRVTETNDPVEEWNEHNQRLSVYNKMLNDYQFEKLHFENSLGTDLDVHLVENHIWAGGGEIAQNGVYFNPNIPTEETFTMPHKWKTNGKVVATKPLNYQGKLIEDFELTFENGKVISYDAKKEKDGLKSLLELDEGSSYIGEIALISHNSPISNLNILFLNTLFDENASCHMALGRAYPMNIKDGNDLPLDELKEKGYNHSMTHVDFMFGSFDMKIVGTTKEGNEVLLFENGNFVI